VKRVLPPVGSAIGSWHKWQLTRVAVLLKMTCSFLHFEHLILTNFDSGSIYTNSTFLALKPFFCVVIMPQTLQL
jgi:hypothetical protein